MAKVHQKVRTGLTVKGITAYPSDAEEGDLVFRSDLFKYSIYRNGNWANLTDDRLFQVQSSTDATSGVNVTTGTPATPFIKFTNGALTSISGIPAGVEGQTITVTNTTGLTILLNNDDATATAANRILTGSGKPLKMKNNASVTLIYDATAARWRVVSGIGTGTADGLRYDLDSLTFRAYFNDEFTEGTADSNSAVDASAGHTNAAYDSANEMFVISYDASKTVTGSGTSMTVSGAPAFTVVAGDLLIVTGQARRIITVTTQTQYVLANAFTVTPSPSATPCTVSQEVATKDIYNIALDGNALSAAFPGSTFSEIMVDYEDTTATGDAIFDVDSVPVIGFTASGDNTSFTDVQTRPTLETTIVTPVFLPAAGSSLYLRFFANQSSGSGTVNLLRYEAFMQKSPALLNANSTNSGGAINAAYGFLDGTGNEYNSTISVVGGKSTITLLGWQYAVGLTPGSPYGSIDVYVNGQMVPRFIDSVVTPDASYTETSPSIITLDSDYSAQNLDYEILQRAQIVDGSSQNSSNIAQIQTTQFKNFLVNGAFDIWQRQTSVTVANGVSSYLADRWYVKNSLGTSGVITYSRVTGSLNGSFYGAQVQITTAPTAAQTNGTELYQVIENPMSIELYGNVISMAANIKALGLVTQVGLQFCYATTEVKPTLFFGTEQLVTVNTSNFSLGRLLAQSPGVLPTTSGVVGVRIRITAVSSGNLYALNNGFVVEQAVVNLGASNMSFARSGRFFSEELIMCQRFYEKTYDLGVFAAAVTNQGTWNYTSPSPAVRRISMPFRVIKRVNPVATIYSPSGAINNVAKDVTGDQAISFSTVSTTMIGFEISTTGAELRTYAHWTADAEI